MGTMVESSYGEQECNKVNVVNRWHLGGWLIRRKHMQITFLSSCHLKATHFCGSYFHLEKLWNFLEKGSKGWFVIADADRVNRCICCLSAMLEAVGWCQHQYIIPWVTFFCTCNFQNTRIWLKGNLNAKINGGVVIFVVSNGFEYLYRHFTLLKVL